MSTTKYSNREALDEALKFYLDAMSQFVVSNLSEQLIKDDLPQLSGPDIRTDMEIKDIAFLIRRHWEPYFRKEFKIEDGYYRSRSYDARSVASLIVEGRNRVSHQRLKKLDSGFTQVQLFLIAEILGEINALEAQREVETIRGKLSEDTAADGNAEHQNAITELKQSLASEKERSRKLSDRVLDNAVKLNDKKKELEKLSKQLAVAKLNENEYEKDKIVLSKQVDEKEKQRKKLDKNLKNAKERNNKLKTDGAGVEKRLEESEAAQADYKKRLETAQEELKDRKAEWKESEERLTAVSNQLAQVQAENEDIRTQLTAMPALFTMATLASEIRPIFPTFGTHSSVRILDRRGIDKKDYLRKLLNQKQPSIIYVQSEEKVEELLTSVLPEKADVIGELYETTPEAKEKEILEKLENGELIAVVSNAVFSTLASAHCVEHFVFCHLSPDLDTFFERCCPVFTSTKDAYLHLLYNAQRDIGSLEKWLAQKYPDRETLINFRRALEGCVGVNGDFIKLKNLYSRLDITGLGITELGIETGLAIFEEVGALERNGDDIKLLPFSRGRKSKIHQKGMELKDGIVEIRAFQLEQSIEQIWEEILEKVNINREQVLRERSIHRIDFQSFRSKGRYSA